MWRSIGKGVLNKTIDVKVQAQKCLNFDVKRFVKYSFSYGTSHILTEQNIRNSNFVVSSKKFEYALDQLFSLLMFVVRSLYIFTITAEW